MSSGLPKLTQLLGAGLSPCASQAGSIFTVYSQTVRRWQKLGEPSVCKSKTEPQPQVTPWCQGAPDGNRVSAFPPQTESILPKLLSLCWASAAPEDQ